MKHEWKKYKHLGERCRGCAKEHTAEAENEECPLPKLELIQPIRAGEN